MHLISEELDTKPPHPDSIREVIEAKAHMQQACLAAVAAASRHKANWEVAQTSGDRFAARLAAIEAPDLFKEAERASVTADKAALTYQALVDQHMIPLREWYVRGHQQLVEQLCELLVGEACQLNEAVMRHVQAAAADQVQLSGMTWLSELERTHVEFTVMKLKENAGLT